MDILPENLLICSTAGRIYALKKTDGSKVWESELDGVTKGVGSLFVFDDKVYVGMNGYLFALNLDDGIEVWRNSLPGMRYRDMSILVTTPNSAEETASFSTQFPAVVIVASYGKICGISSESGMTIWNSELKDSGYNLPSVMLDSSSLNTILVGCGKQLYKINIRNGEIIWRQIIYNGYGSPYVTMATHQNSLRTALTHTELNNNPIAK